LPCGAAPPAITWPRCSAPPVNCVGLVYGIACCGSRFKPENAFWTDLFNALPETEIDRDHLPHPSRIVEMTGIDRGKIAISTRWIRARSQTARMSAALVNPERLLLALDERLDNRVQLVITREELFLSHASVCARRQWDQHAAHVDVRFSYQAGASVRFAIWVAERHASGIEHLVLGRQKTSTISTEPKKRALTGISPHPQSVYMLMQVL
jgi:hypothetical protein